MHLVSCRAKHTVVQNLPSSAVQMTHPITNHAEYSLHMLRKDCIQARIPIEFNIIHRIITVR